MSRAKPPVLTATCPVCRREFKTTNPHKIYCDYECYCIARQRRKRANRRMRRQARSNKIC